MPKVNCNVIGCSNSTYKINKWKKETCTKHILEAEGNTARRKGTVLNVNNRFIYILFLVPLNVNN